MSDVTDDELQGWIDGLRSADAARRDKAIRDLVGHAYERLRALARKMLRADFPRLAPHHETGSVLDAAALRLLKTLGQCRPTTVAEFFGLAAQQIRWVLLDLARAAPRPGAMAEEPADSRADPARLAEWTEFHRRVEQLPDEERQVVDLHFYKGLTQAQTARLLGLHEKEVSRRWLRAARKLPAWAPGE